MDFFLHLLGICQDTQSHFDLLDLLVPGMGGLTGLLALGRYALCRLRGRCG